MVEKGEDYISLIGMDEKGEDYIILIGVKSIISA